LASETLDRLNFAEVVVYGSDGAEIQGIEASYGPSVSDGCDGATYPASYAIDSSASSFFLLWATVCDKYWQLDLGKNYDVGKVVITSRAHNGG